MLRTIIITGAILVAIPFVGLLAFVVWRFTSTERGIREVDELILREIKPIRERLVDQEPVSPEEVRSLARKAYLRPKLYQALARLGRLDLFPVEYLDRRAEAEARLAYFLMLPHELHGRPVAIEFVESVQAPDQGKQAEFLVFRYRMAEGRLAHKHGWLLGGAGPYFAADKPYDNQAAGFSREGMTEASELVRWYVGVRAWHSPSTGGLQR
jgi:hypothetical protein